MENCVNQLYPMHTDVELPLMSEKKARERAGEREREGERE